MARYLNFRDGGKTDEEGIARPYSKFLDGEVFEGLNVTQQTVPAMGIKVSAGDIMIDSGNGYPYMGWSDADENITLTAADGSNPRYDLIVAYVDLAVVDSTNPNNPNALKFDNVTGTPAGAPAEPNAAAIEAVIGASNPYAVLARVTVGAGVTTISNSAIVDRRSIVAISADEVGGGWDSISVAPTVATGYNKGNKEFELTFPSVDLTGDISPGMKFKVDRSGTTPTQCTDLEASSSQYANKSSPTGITFTDDYTCEAWIKLESYTLGFIVARLNSAATSGWGMRISANGLLEVMGYNATADVAATYQSIPLNQWVHVAVTLDMSGATATTYINGALVPNTYTNGAASALVQAGDLTIGRFDGGQYFDGKVADVRVWNAVRTATQIRDNMNQQLVGNETNLVAYYKLNGNFLDSTANANNLTGQNSAVATNSDHPFKTTEFGIVTKIAYSTNTTVTLFTGTDYNIPNAILENPYYSKEDTPYAFDTASGKWRVNTLIKTQTLVLTPSAGTWYNISSFQLSVPTGAWKISQEAHIYGAKTANDLFIKSTVSTANNTESDAEMTAYIGSYSTASGLSKREKQYILSSQTIYYCNVATPTATLANLQLLSNSPDYGPSQLYAQCAYID